jgi:hypothetical protein
MSYNGVTRDRKTAAAAIAKETDYGILPAAADSSHSPPVRLVSRRDYSDQQVPKGLEDHHHDEVPMVQPVESKRLLLKAIHGDCSPFSLVGILFSVCSASVAQAWAISRRATLWPEFEAC